MGQIRTTHGDMDESLLAKTTVFEDRPTEWVIAIEYRLGDEIVRRDAHVVLKAPSVVADALSAEL